METFDQAGAGRLASVGRHAFVGLREVVAHQADAGRALRGAATIGLTVVVAGATLDAVGRAEILRAAVGAAAIVARRRRSRSPAGTMATRRSGAAATATGRGATGGGTVERTDATPTPDPRSGFGRGRGAGVGTGGGPNLRGFSNHEAAARAAF